MSRLPASKWTEAQAAIDRGWKLIPLHGKRPIEKNWPESRGMTREEVASHLTGAATNNVGVNCGASGLLVVDVDDSAAWEDVGIRLPRTPRAVTGRGGVHLYFKMPNPPLGNSRGSLPAGVDIRGKGGQVALAGSIHPDTGVEYRWSVHPQRFPPCEVPHELLERLRPREREADPICLETPRRAGAYAAAALRNEVERVASAGRGTRNEQLNKSAFALGRFVAAQLLFEYDVAGALLQAADACGLVREDGEARCLDTITRGIAAGRGSA